MTSEVKCTMLSSSSYKATSAAEASKQKLISCNTGIVANNIISEKQIPYNKCNKLSTDLSDLFSASSSDMSKSITTSRSLLNHPASLTTSIKGPPIIAAVHSQHNQQQQRHFVIKKHLSGDHIKCDTEQNSHSTDLLDSSTPTPSLEPPTSSSCTNNKINAIPLITHKFPRTIPSNKVSQVSFYSILMIKFVTILSLPK